MNTRIFQAFLFREVCTCRANRILLILFLLSIALGITPLLMGFEGSAGFMVLLQGILYIIPLFALLAGAHNAQEDAFEELLLASQPCSPFPRIAGKLGVHLAVFAFFLMLIVLPHALFNSGGFQSFLAMVYGLGLSAVFLTVGLFLGFSFGQSLKVYVFALIIWILAVFGTSLAALLFAGSSLARDMPSLWIALLALNPVEASRIGMLFQIEAIPFDLTQIPATARLWLSWPTLWFLFLALSITTLMSILTHRAMRI